MSDHKEAETKGSIPRWARALEESGFTNFAESISEDEAVKLEGQAMLQTLGLPRYYRIKTTASDFLKDPDAILKKLSTEKYYITFITDKMRAGGVNLNKDQALDFVRRRSADETTEATAIVGEYLDNAYGGSIVINKDGKVYLELAEGLHQELARGMKTPSIAAEMDPRTQVLRCYTFNKDKKGQREDLQDTEMKQVLARTLQCIPKNHHIRTYTDSENMRSMTVHHPGYYEFILTNQKPGDSHLSPIFLDYRGGKSGEKYQLR